MNTVVEKYKNSSVYMVSGLDSLGVPYTLDNTHSKAFIDIIADQFKQNGISIEYVNLCSLAKNKTWELINILKSDFTKEEYYKRNQKYAQLVISRGSEKNGRFNHPVNPNFVDQYYSNISNPNIKITSKLVSSPNPIFIYTCGGMNFDYYSKMPTCDIRQILPQLVLHLNQNIEKTMNDIDNCINYITELNPNMEVYVLGVYPMLENKLLRLVAQPLYAIYNNKLQEICKKHTNVYYVDIFNTKKFIAPHDNHPTFEGQEYMAKQIIKTIKQNI